ncbi:MAG: hypothetical protein ACI4JS_10415 [Oscillospiraceae bacterium]
MIEITKNGKKIEIAENELYDYVIQEAIKDTKENFPEKVVYIADAAGIPRGYSMNEFSQRLLSKQEEFKTYSDNYANNQPLTNTAFAAQRAVQVMYDLCVASEVNRNIDKVLNETGLPQNVKTEVGSNLKNYFNELLENSYKKPSTKKLAKELMTAYEGHGNTQKEMRDFLNRGLNYIERVNNHLFEEDKKPEEALIDAHHGPGLFRVFNDDIIPFIHEAISDYSKSYESDMDVYFTYDSKDKVKPHEFLKHYQENPESLSDDEKQWAGKLLANMEINLHTKGTGNISWTDYKADGVQLISEDEVGNVKNDKIKAEDLDCKIVAAILSGKDVSVKPKDPAAAEVHLNPEIICTTPENIIDEILQAIAEFLHIKTEKSIVKSLNENMSERKQVPFSELIEKSSPDTVTAPPKKLAEEKSKELGSAKTL